MDNRCPLCDSMLPPPRVDRNPYSFGNALVFECNCCGAFLIEKRFLNLRLPTILPRDRGVLSILARRRRDTDPDNPIQIAAETIDKLLDGYSQPSVESRRQALLAYLARESDDVGTGVGFDPSQEFPRFDCTSKQAMIFVVDSLVSSGLIDVPEQGRLRLTPSGWHAIGDGNRGQPGTCFVAMSFAPEMELAREAIDRAVDAVRLRPLRVDKVEHNDNINDFIMAEIRRAEMMVADFSMHRHGVYFEAGFALGLGREVIYCCRETDFAATHFDTRAYNHIVWKTEADLESRLRVRLLNTVPSLRNRT